MSIASIGEAIENPSVTQLLAAYPTKEAFDAAARSGKIKPTTEAGVAANIFNRIVQSALANQAQAQAQTTVFQDNTQPQTPPQMGLAAAAAQPQMPQRPGQGLDQVPVPPEMFDEQRMAGGGIVAFQPGGNVKVPSLQDILKQMSMQELQNYQRTGQLPEKYRMMLPGAEPAPTFTQSLRDANQADTGAQYGARPIPGSQVLAQKADAAGNIYRDALFRQNAEGASSTFAPFDEVIPALGEGVPEPVDPFSATQGGTSIRGGQTDTGAVDYSRETPTPGLEPAAPPAAPPKAKPTEEKPAAKEGEAEKPNTYDDYLKEVMDRMGTSTVGKGMREDIEKDRAERKKAKQEAMWMRVVEAGLGIMGGESPYAMVNIGKGATNALKGYADDLREQKKLDREDRKILLDLERAERAEQRDNYKLAADLREKALDRMSAEQRTRISADATRYAADKSLEAYSMLKPGPAITSRLKLAEAVDAQLVMDREYQKLRKQNPAAAEAFRKRIIDARANEIGLGGGAGLGASGPVLDYSALMGIK